jgi:glycosidase
MRLAVTFQMTYVGMPEIYYGDEVGMVGETDPDCRRTMIWDEDQQNKEMFEWHQKLISIRKQHKALQTGAYRTVIKDPLANLYGFVREDDSESILVLLNNSPHPHKTLLPGNTSGIDLLSGNACKGQLNLEPYGARIILLEASQ